MKKNILALGVMLVCAICFFAVRDRTVAEHLNQEEKRVDTIEKTKQTANQGGDYTVEVKNAFSLSEYGKTEEVAITNDYALSDSVEEMSEVADDIVGAEVIKVEYVSIDGDAWTKVDLKIDSVYKGELNIGDSITVYQSGGYQPLKCHIASYDDAFRYSDLSDEEIENTILHEVSDNEEDTVVGSSAIYLLRKSTKTFLPNGVYTRVRGKYSKLVDMKGDMYRCYNDTTQKGYKDRSLKEIKKYFR